jgi:hypothetical protein
MERVCPQCGTEPISGGKRLCEPCRLANRRRHREEVLAQKRMIADESKGDSGCEPAAALDRQAVAAILGITWQAVQETERRALWKLRRNPVVRRIYREYVTGEAVPSVNGHNGKRVSRAQVMMTLGEWSELADQMEGRGCLEEAEGVRVEVRRLAQWLAEPQLEIAAAVDLTSRPT